jgi:uncharacterized protein
MNCPVCNVPLTMMERQGVEIDYCQRCRGVWLDRGELDKIIERSAGIQPQNFSGGHQPQQHYSSGSHYNQNIHDSDDQRYKHQSHSSHYDQYGHKKKKKESFLGELFDF